MVTDGTIPVVFDVSVMDARCPTCRLPVSEIEKHQEEYAPVVVRCASDHLFAVADSYGGCNE